MKECLHCKKKFQEKKDTAKYCSDSCRVMFNRKHKLKALKFAAASNNTLLADLVEKVDRLLGERINYTTTTPNSINGGRVNTFRQDETHQWQEPPKALKTLTKYIQEKRECEIQEQYEALLAEVEADPYLTQKQKTAFKLA